MKNIFFEKLEKKKFPTLISPEYPNVKKILKMKLKESSHF